jgi:hypothetical protein
VLAATLLYPQITLTVNVAANAPSSVTHVVTVSGGNDGNAANNTASDPTLIITSGADLQIAPLSSGGNFAQGQSNVSYLVVVSNQGSVSSSGTVTVTNTLSPGLTGTAISGPGWTCTLANLTCTRTDSLPVAQGFSAITVTFNVSNTAPANSSATMTVSGGGDAVLSNNTATFGVAVTQAIAVALNGTGISTVNAGSPATYNLSLTLGAAAGTVTFACSGLPTGAACSFNPPSLTASGAEVVTVSTTSRSTSLPAEFRVPNSGTPLVVVVLLGLAILAASGLSGRRLRRRLAFAAAGLLIVCVMGACGGGGSGSNFTPTPVPTPTPNPNGTPAGTYQLFVTASGASSPASQPITLVVK